MITLPIRIVAPPHQLFDYTRQLAAGHCWAISSKLPSQRSAHRLIACQRQEGTLRLEPKKPPPRLMPNAVSGKHVRNVMWLDKCMSSLRGLNRILHSVLGCRYITSRSGGLKPSAVAGRPSVTRFTSTKRILSRNASNTLFPCLLLLSAPGSPKQLHWSQACCCFLTCEDDVAYWHSSCFRLLGAVGSVRRSSGLEGNLSPLSGLDCNPRGS